MSFNKKYEMVELPPDLEDYLEPKSKKSKSDKERDRSSKSRDKDRDRDRHSEKSSRKDKHKHKDEDYERERERRHKHKKSKKEKEDTESNSPNEEKTEIEEPKPTVNRDSWMTEEPTDFLGFGNIKSRREEREEREGKPNKKTIPDQGYFISSREANPYLNGTLQAEDGEEVDLAKPSFTGPGNQGYEEIEAEEDESIYPQETSTTPSIDMAALTDDLNRLNSKILRAKLRKNTEEAQKLELEYKELQEKANEIMLNEMNKDKVVVLPEYDIRGRRVDIGSDKQYPHHKPSKNKESNTSSSSTFDILKLAKLEKQSSGMEYDRQLASQISRDAAFKNDVDYMNDTISHLSKESSKSDTSKRHSAINDYKRSEKAIERCYYCFKDQNTPPATPVVSIGHRVYLGLPNVKELVPGHCQIIPIEHNITTLDCDDDTWSEIRNFMKCIIRCFDAKKCGVIFMETVIDLKSYYHTVIECIPLPYDQYDDCPAYFKEALLESDSNWSQHSKVIDTSKRGFRRSLTSNLPYFHVWYHLDEGIGHVIEEKEKFPQWFGKEVIAGILDLDPSKWRRPDRYSSRDNGPRIEEFKKKFNWDEYNWTSVLDE